MTMTMIFTMARLICPINVPRKLISKQNDGFSKIGTIL